MPQLNQGLTWDKVNPEDRKAFQDKFALPTLEFFDTGTLLYRLSDDDVLTPHKGGLFSPWWSPYNRFKDGVGWEDRKNFAKTVGVSVREWVRLTSVIQEDRNSCKFLKIITLKQGVWGFVGGFKGMSRTGGGASKALPGEGKGPTANLPGGATQIYIPGLSVEHAAFLRSEDLSHL